MENSSSLGYFVEAMGAYRQKQNGMVLADLSFSMSTSSHFVGTPSKEQLSRVPPKLTPPAHVERSPKMAERVRLMHGITAVSLLVFGVSLYWSRPSHPALKRLAGFCGMPGGIGGAFYSISRRASYVDLADRATWERFRDEATKCSDFPRFVRRVCSHVTITARGEEEPLKPTMFSEHRLFQHYPFFTPGTEVEELTGKLAEAVVECDQIYAKRKAIIDARAQQQLKNQGWTAFGTVGKQWYQQRMELRHTSQYVEQTLQLEFLDLRYQGLIEKPLFVVNVNPLGLTEER